MISTSTMIAACAVGLILVLLAFLLGKAIGRRRMQLEMRALFLLHGAHQVDLAMSKYTLICMLGPQGRSIIADLLRNGLIERSNSRQPYRITPVGLAFLSISSGFTKWRSHDI